MGGVRCAMGGMPRPRRNSAAYQPELCTKFESGGLHLRRMTTTYSNIYATRTHDDGGDDTGVCYTRPRSADRRAGKQPGTWISESGPMIFTRAEMHHAILPLG